MPSIDELRPLVSEPREALDAEYKQWLDLTNAEHRATLAKAAIALANHGGGYIVLGFEDRGALACVPRPQEVPAIVQDAVNAAIQRFATPEFHCELYEVPAPIGGILCPVIVVPGKMTEPVMSKRDCEGVIARNRVYIRKPGPRSEEPQSGEEWRALLRRCVQAGREDMLEAIRSIVSGRVEPAALPPDAQALLHAFVEDGRARWLELSANTPEGNPARFPLGHFEIGLSLVGALPAPSLGELQRRLDRAREIRLTGWTPFLAMNRAQWAPYAHHDFVEAWVGRPTGEERNFDDPAHADFWRASRDGKLYSIRGYTEDSLLGQIAPGRGIDITLPIWRIGEAVLFAARLAETFADVDAVAVETTFTGLENRFLTSIGGRRAIFDDRVSRTAEITLTGRATLAQLRDNFSEFMLQLVTPLYERFDFFTPTAQLVDEELNRLRGGRF